MTSAIDKTIEELQKGAQWFYEQREVEGYSNRMFAERIVKRLKPQIDAEKKALLEKVFEIAQDNSFTFKGRQGGPYIEISLLRRIIDKELS